MKACARDDLTETRTYDGLYKLLAHSRGPERVTISLAFALVTISRTRNDLTHTRKDHTETCAYDKPHFMPHL